MQIVTSWDDGHELDLKIADLLEKYKLPGIFYIPNVAQGIGANDMRWLVKRGFEIGGHTVSHPRDMKLLTSHEAEWEIKVNKQWIEETIRKPITSFCYPRGRYNDKTIALVQKAGYTNARTTDVLEITYPQDVYRTRTSIHVKSNRREYNGQNWLLVAKDTFDAAAKQNGYFHLWGHSWEIESESLWGDLEDLLTYIHGHQSN